MQCLTYKLFFFFPLTQCISFCAKMALSFHRRPKEMKYYTHLLALSIILKKIFFRCRSAPYPVSNFLSVLKKCLLVNLILLFVRPDEHWLGDVLLFHRVWSQVLQVHDIEGLGWLWNEQGRDDLCFRFRQLWQNISWWRSGRRILQNLLQGL